MEDMSRAAIAEKNREMTGLDEMPRWIAAIDKHIATGSPAYFYLDNEAALVEFTKLIGHETITSEQVIAYHYSATADERCEHSGESYAFDGEASLIALQEQLGDNGVNLEFPNDFRVNLAIALDAETMVVYSHEISAAPGVCRECDESDDPELKEELQLNEGRYGCGHLDDMYFTRDHAQLMKRQSGAETLSMPIMQ